MAQLAAHTNKARATCAGMAGNFVGVPARLVEDLLTASQRSCKPCLGIRLAGTASWIGSGIARAARVRLGPVTEMASSQHAQPLIGVAICKPRSLSPAAQN